MTDTTEVTVEADDATLEGILGVPDDASGARSSTEGSVQLSRRPTATAGRPTAHQVE